MLCPAACDGAPSGPRLREPPRGRFLMSISPSAVLKFHVPFIDPVEGLVIELLGLEISHVAVAAGLNRVQACGLKDRWHVRSGTPKGKQLKLCGKRMQAHNEQCEATEAVRSEPDLRSRHNAQERCVWMQWTVAHANACHVVGMLRRLRSGILGKAIQSAHDTCPAPTHAAHSSDAQEAVYVLSR